MQARERRGEQGRERRGEGEARRGRGEERQAREKRGGGCWRESEGEAGGSVSVNQIEGEEGLYSESNSGRSVGEGGKFATTPSHYSKQGSPEGTWVPQRTFLSIWIPFYTQ